MNLFLATPAIVAAIKKGNKLAGIHPPPWKYVDGTAVTITRVPVSGSSGFRGTYTCFAVWEAAAGSDLRALATS